MLGYAGPPMASTLAHDVARVFRPRTLLNHLGSTEVYTFTVCNRVLEKPTCAGRPGLFGRTRIVAADPERRGSVEALVPRGETGELIVALDSPEAITGYDLDRFCQAAKDFASFKRPRRYELVTSLPKSPAGKLLRRRLQEVQRRP